MARKQQSKIELVVSPDGVESVSLSGPMAITDSDGRLRNYAGTVLKKAYKDIREAYRGKGKYAELRRVTLIVEE